MELLQVMYDLLEKTLVPAADDRAAGEQGLEQLQARAGFVPALFTVAGTAAVRPEVRLAAALYCKNFIRMHWARGGPGGSGYARAVQTVDVDADHRIVEEAEDEDEDEEGEAGEEGCLEDLSEASSGGDMRAGGHGLKSINEGGKGSPISAADRKAVRAMIVPVYFACASLEAVRKTVGKCVELLAVCDYPQRLRHLLPAIVERLELSSHPLSDVVSALLLLREVSRIFESIGADKALANVDPFLDAVLEPTLTVAYAALEAPPDHAASAFVTKIVCKILWSSTSLHFNHGHGLPGGLTSSGAVLARLLDYLLAVKRRTVPEVALGAREEEAEGFWGPHKWATRLWMRLLNRYSAPTGRQFFPPALALDAPPHAEALSARAITREVIRYMPPVLLETLLLLDRTFEGAQIPAKTHAEMLEFVADSVAVPQTWKVLKEQLMPLLCI